METWSNGRESGRNISSNRSSGRGFGGHISLVGCNNQEDTLISHRLFGYVLYEISIEPVQYIFPKNYKYVDNDDIAICGDTD